MSDTAVPNPDTEAERLEAALERIAAFARRPPPEPSSALGEADTMREQAAAELDGLIARLRDRLGDLGEAPHPATADGDDALRAGTDLQMAGVGGVGGDRI